MSRIPCALAALALCVSLAFATPVEGLMLSAIGEEAASAAPNDSLLPAASVEGLTLSEPIKGERVSPDSEAEATCRMSFSYPQFVETDETAKNINAFYRSLSEDMALALGEEATIPDGDAAAYAELSYLVARNDSMYLSVVLSSRVMLGNAENETISADTFARDGLYAGQPISLTQVLGLERTDDALEGGKSLAETIVYGLVWQIISAAAENTDAGYPEGITVDKLYAAFSPETDFYLDSDGNIVFFIQSGEIAGEIAGVLYFPFAPMELLSAGE